MKKNNNALFVLLLVGLIVFMNQQGKKEAWASDSLSYVQSKCADVVTTYPNAKIWQRTTTLTGCSVYCLDSLSGTCEEAYAECNYDTLIESCSGSTLLPCPISEWNEGCPTEQRCTDLSEDYYSSEPTYDCTGFDLLDCQRKAIDEVCQGTCGNLGEICTTPNTDDSSCCSGWCEAADGGAYDYPHCGDEPTCVNHLQSCTENSDCCSGYMCKDGLSGKICIDSGSVKLWAFCTDGTCQPCYDEPGGSQSCDAGAEIDFTFSIVAPSSPDPCMFKSKTLNTLSDFYNGYSECTTAAANAGFCKTSGQTCSVVNNECCDNLTCISGTCQSYSCTDSDGGIDSFVKGTVVSSIDGTKIDHCANEGTYLEMLLEYSCNTGYSIKETQYLCDCFDGKCASSNTTCSPTLDCGAWSDCINGVHSRTCTTSSTCARTENCSIGCVCGNWTWSNVNQSCGTGTRNCTVGTGCQTTTSKTCVTVDACNNECLGIIQTCDKTTGKCKTSGTIIFIGVLFGLIIVVKAMGGTKK